MGVFCSPLGDGLGLFGKGQVAVTGAVSSQHVGVLREGCGNPELLLLKVEVGYAVAGRGFDQVPHPRGGLDYC